MSKQNDKISKILWGMYLFGMLFLSNSIYEEKGFYPAIFLTVQFIWLNTTIILRSCIHKRLRRV